MTAQSKLRGQKKEAVWTKTLPNIDDITARNNCGAPALAVPAAAFKVVTPDRAKINTLK